MKTDFKRHQDAFSVMLLVRHVLIAKTIIARNAHPNIIKMNILKLRILKNVSRIAQKGNIYKIDRVSYVIEHVLHALVAKIINAINVQMDFYKIKLQLLRILKSASRLVQKDLINVMNFVRHVIAHANHALASFKIIVLNVQMDLNKIQLFKLRVLKDVYKHVLLARFLTMMECA